MKCKHIRIAVLALFVIILCSSISFAEEFFGGFYSTEVFDDPIITNYSDEGGQTGSIPNQSTNLLPNKGLNDFVPYDPPGGSFPYTSSNFVYLGIYNTQVTPNYNCYLYALGITSGGKHNPGYYSTSGSWNIYTDSEQDFHDKLFSDLLNMGYSPRDSNSSEIPGTGETKICYRFAYYGNGNIRDYHFMKYVNGDWRHKPGLTSILTYRKSITNTSWVSEGFTVYDGWLTNNWGYTGTVHFVIY